MSCQGVAKISTTPDLLIRIYELLNFVDQLRLSRVNQQLKSIFLNYIHPYKYHVLNIMKTRTENYLVFGELGIHQMLLTPEELEEFVRVYAANVDKLVVDSSKTFSCFNSQYRTSIVSIEQFRNLTRLQYVSLMIQEEHMQSIAASCPHLRELHLFDCWSKDGVVFLMIANSLSNKTLQRMEKLKSLVVDGISQANDIKYSVFCELVTKLNLECLKLDAFLVAGPDDTESAKDNTQHHHIKELQISTSFDCEIWGNMFLSFLGNFENISILTLRIPDDVTDAILDIIAKTCKNLEKFTIHSYTKFRDIKQFSMPPKVTDLSLINCYGLTHGNLKILLTQFKIHTFKSHEVAYLGEFEDFPISPYIQSLDLDAVSTYKFPSAYVNNANLKELNWYLKHYTSLSSCQDPGPLETCINLEILNVSGGFIPSNAILKLNLLQKLKIPQAMPNLSWSYITALLKHPPLHELDVNAFFDIDLATDLLNTSDIPTRGFPTNIKILKITFVVFELGLNFWLDLLNQNRDMMFICNSFEIEEEFLKKLIGHDSFPSDLRTIDIWGFSINCKDLRENFNATMKTLNQAKNRFASEFIIFEKISRLILSRK